MSSDLFTKTCAGPLFDKHAANYVGHDKYMAVGESELNYNELN